jgi:hypothetical protein
MLDLLKDKPYMHSNSPKTAVEDPEPPTDDDSDDEGNDPAPPSIEDENDDPPPPPHPNTIVLPVETRPIEELRDGARRASSRKRTERSPTSMSPTPRVKPSCRRTKN